MTRTVVRVSEMGARHTGEPSCGHGVAVTTAGVRETAVWPPVHFFSSELSSDATKNQVFRDIMTRGVVRASETGSRHSGKPSCGHGAAVTTAGVRETGAWPPVHFLKVFRWHLVAQAPPKYQIYLMDDGCFCLVAQDRVNSQEKKIRKIFHQKTKILDQYHRTPLKCLSPDVLNSGYPYCPIVFTSA